MAYPLHRRYHAPTTYGNGPWRMPMLNLLRKFLRPTLREQLEDGVREALRKYADRQTAPDLRVFVSSDLLPEGVDQEIWTRDEAEHLRAFGRQWAQDHHISRAGMHVEVVVLDTRREFAFVKPLGLPEKAPAPLAGEARDPSQDAYAAAVGPPRIRLAAPESPALLEVVSAPTLLDAIPLHQDVVLGRRDDDGVRGTGDRYMSARHAKFSVDGASVRVTDLDSKNRTFVNEVPLPAHQPRELHEGDTIRMGTTTLRVAHPAG
jgi:hypothetical protein